MVNPVRRTTGLEINTDQGIWFRENCGGEETRLKTRYRSMPRKTTPQRNKIARATFCSLGGNFGSDGIGRLFTLEEGDGFPLIEGDERVLLIPRSSPLLLLFLAIYSTL